LDYSWKENNRSHISILQGYKEAVVGKVLRLEDRLNILIDFCIPYIIRYKNSEKIVSEIVKQCYIIFEYELMEENVLLDGPAVRDLINNIWWCSNGCDPGCSCV
jgi:hypothetical protein